MRPETSGSTGFNRRSARDEVPACFVLFPAEWSTPGSEDAARRPVGGANSPIRDAPFGMRARVSADAGANWSEEIILRDDGGISDLGYPRFVVRSDGQVLTVYYYNYGMDQDRFIGGTVFTVD